MSRKGQENVLIVASVLAMQNGVHAIIFFAMNPLTTGLTLKSDSAIDLHLHTTYSDGRWTPEALFDHLLREQFKLAAVSDHDRPDTVAAIQQLALEKGLPVITAAEMSATWKGEMVDMLCYGFGHGPNALTELAQELMHRQQENTRQVCADLQKQGIALPAEGVNTVLAKPNVEQPHALAALLKENGYGSGNPSVGELLLGSGCKFELNEPAAVLEAAHKSGAVCMLAHPGHGDGFVDYDTQRLDEFLQEAPVDGLEVYHPLHDFPKTGMYAEYARRHGLLISAGSDSHKPEKPPIKYRAESCRDLLERLGIRVE
jgi:3',5'-nucleoside bisphosphate phosphatase